VGRGIGVVPILRARLATGNAQGPNKKKHSKRTRYRLTTRKPGQKEKGEKGEAAGVRNEQPFG